VRQIEKAGKLTPTETKNVEPSWPGRGHKARKAEKRDQGPQGTKRGCIRRESCSPEEKNLKKKKDRDREKLLLEREGGGTCFNI